jgi:hypothetical protein
MDEHRKVFTLMNNKSFNFNIKVKASGKSDSIDKLIYIDGTYYIKITVKAVPESGKANKAIIDLLSRKWSIPKNTISIIRGSSSNYKLLNIEIDNLTEQMLHFNRS